MIAFVQQNCVLIKFGIKKYQVGASAEFENPEQETTEFFASKKIVIDNFRLDRNIDLFYIFLIYALILLNVELAPQPIGSLMLVIWSIFVLLPWLVYA